VDGGVFEYDILETGLHVLVIPNPRSHFFSASGALHFKNPL
jgi:hypothetical protein